MSTFYKDYVPKAKMPTERHAIEYNLNHKNRGLAIIFNHVTFNGNSEPRDGTDKDTSNLETMFTNLGFKVSIHNDCTLSEIQQHIDRATRIDHTDSDCIAIALLTHGYKDGTVHAKDKQYNLDDIFNSFTAEKCPTLAGKPKLFFIQACRGKKTDVGMKIQTDGHGSDHSVSYRIPLQADFLISYSTVPDYVSFRNATDGSIYIRALVKTFQENGTNYDILTLLTFVNQYVSFEFESCSTDPQNDRKKQMPSFTCMLTRILRFNKKTNMLKTTTTTK